MKMLVDVDAKLKVKKLEDLIEEPKIIRVVEFDDEGVAEFEKQIAEAHQTGQDVIPVVIDSFGGSVYALLAMMAAIDNSTLPVATIVSGKAMSCGAMLFCYGTEGYRFMDKHAVLMVHEASSMTCGKVEDIKVDVAHLDQVNRKLYKRVALHLGHPENYLLDLLKNRNNTDWFLTARDARKHKMANHLRIPQLKVSVKLLMEFG